ncbi:MAG: zinc-binding alcohol dehydrogenase family protein [Candidatus Eremiobacteraeota bacterium]|nr:zinc-binding alcohol dehydrogenase family protein [Candidatus Eremiobacteraeota bacterium]
MKAVGYYHPLPVDDPNSLIDIELPMPQPLPRDIVVRVAAVSVNPVDVKQRARAAPPEGTARILGFDAAGTVTALGNAASRFRVGDEVYYAGAIDRAGTNAEYHAVDERIAGLRPTTISAAHAAALPLTSLTAWELLFDRLAVPYGRKVAGDALLIVNGAGGVGSILTQIARRLTGLTVIATASRPETVAWCRKMGAHHVIDHHEPLDRGLAAIGIPHVRYVAGLTATDRHRDAIVAALAPQGALAMIDDPEIFDVVPFKRKSLAVHWELMFTRSLFGTPDMAEQGRILSEIAALVDSGVLQTTFREDAGSINAGNVRTAHALVESGRAFGKTVLSGF